MVSQEPSLAKTLAGKGMDKAVFFLVTILEYILKIFPEGVCKHKIYQFDLFEAAECVEILTIPGISAHRK